jgi:cell pole-organizing protein PopZ
MNSAEKKSSEPSMDDIISSIRNIIADDNQDVASIPQPSAVETTQPPVVQLTENQIAEPAGDGVVASEVEQVVAVPESIVTPETPTKPEPVPDEPLNAVPSESATVAALDIVGVVEKPLDVSQASVPVEATPVPEVPVMATPEVVASVDIQPTVSPEAPEIPAVIPAPEAQAAMIPIPVVKEASAVEEVAVASVPENQPVASATEEAVIQQESPAAKELADMENAQPTDEVVVSSETPVASLMDVEVPAPVVTEPPHVEPVAPATEAQAATSAEVSSHPAENIIQTPVGEAGEGIAEKESVGPVGKTAGIEGAQVDPVAKELSASSPLEQDAVEKVESVVLDASKVSPEDAAALSAVATATSEAMAGNSQPEKKECSNSLEDSIKEMLKPMIREWLDDNMPRILEGAVKEEVKSSGNDES